MQQKHNIINVLTWTFVRLEQFSVDCYTAHCWHCTVLHAYGNWKFCNINTIPSFNAFVLLTVLVASFPGFPCLQILIACNMWSKTGSGEKAWKWGYSLELRDKKKSSSTFHCKYTINYIIITHIALFDRMWEVRTKFVIYGNTTMQKNRLSSL